MTLASLGVVGDAETIACSMSASSSTTQVPGSHVKLDRTCSGTWWFHANSTARNTRTRPPVAAISSISSKEIRLIRCAVGHDPGVGGEDPGHIGVDLAGVGAEHGGQRDSRRVGAAPPERRDVAVGRDALEAGDDGDLAGRQGFAEAVRRDLEDLGPPCSVSVTIPAWLPVKVATSDPQLLERHREQRHRDALTGAHEHVVLARRLAG